MNTVVSSGRRLTPETARALVEERLERPIPPELWALPPVCEQLADLVGHKPGEVVDAVDNLCQFLEGALAVHAGGPRSPRPVRTFERRAPPDASLETVARVLQLRAAQHAGVARFRAEILGGRFVADAASWITRMAGRTGALGQHSDRALYLHYRITEDDLNQVKALPVRSDRSLPELPKPARALAWLAVLERDLSAEWGLEPEDVGDLVLTGHPPKLHTALARIETRATAALNRVILTVSPNMKPQALAEFYASVRTPARRGWPELGTDARIPVLREKPVEQWKGSLVHFIETANDGRTTWEEAMERWNAETTHTTRHYTVVARFRRVATEAVRRVLGEELTWKNPGGVPGQRHWRTRRKA